MVMLFSEESSSVGENPGRNSLGWRIKEGKPELVTWSHGYLWDRYAGPGDWEEVRGNSNPKKDLLRGEKIKKKFYLAFDEGELATVFSYFRLFREHFRQGLTHG